MAKMLVAAVQKYLRPRKFISVQHVGPTMLNKSQESPGELWVSVWSSVVLGRDPVDPQ